MRLLFLLLLSAANAFPQLFSFGVKGGVPLTDAFKVSEPSAYFSDSRRYAIGPVLELNLPFRISVELDAMYKPMKYGSDSRYGSPVVTTGNSWEFPLLMKYRLTGGLVRPYLGAGLAFRRFTGLKQDSGTPSELRDRSSMGAVLGGGLELRVPLVRLSGELRYTRWGSTSFRSAVGDLVSQVNQADFLLGITF